MNSALYEGKVWHRRFWPVRHQFRYTLGLLLLDLSEVEKVFAGRWFWSTGRGAPFRFRRSDHFGPPSQPLEDAVRDLVEARGLSRPRGPIRLLTPLRSFGFWMNPISIFFCYDAEGERVETVVAEVNNTPWKQQHCYVLDSGSGMGRAMRFRNGKAFHVSPFLDMEMDYLWRVTPPGVRLSVRIENQVHGQTLFDAVLQLKRREISTGSLARHAVRFPLNTLKVFLAIYWQAMHLWRKGVPYVPHPGLSPSMGSNGGIEPSKISDS